MANSWGFAIFSRLNKFKNSPEVLVVFKGYVKVIVTFTVLVRYKLFES